MSVHPDRLAVKLAAHRKLKFRPTKAAERLITAGKAKIVWGPKGAKVLILIKR